MSFAASCVRCSGPVLEAPDDPEGRWACPQHGLTRALWHADEATYEAFGEHLALPRRGPPSRPGPRRRGWAGTDGAAGGAGPARARASLTCVSGTSELDGPVDVLVVAEEAGTGLGARCASTRYDDPGADIGHRPPTVRIRIGSQSVNLWDVSTSGADGEFDRSVVAGEAAGRWLWIVLRPASALLLLRDDWILRDVSHLGPQLVELPFGGPRPSW